MRGFLRPVSTRIGALLGLVCLLPIAVMLLRHQIDLVSAAKRAAIVFAGVLVAERLLLPIVLLLLSSGKQRERPGPDANRR